MEPFLLHALVEHGARVDPEHLAVGHAEARISYAQLDRMANAIAARLVREGVKVGDRVGLYQPKSIRAVASLIGILKTGAAYVPIDPAAPAERARYILDHCGIDVLISSGRPLRGLPQGRPLSLLLLGDAKDQPSPAAAVCESLDVVLERAEPFSPVRITDTSLAYILYTSGSTGAPKGVAITHAQSLAFVRTATDIFEMSPNDVVASHAPFNFDLSIIDLFCTFLARGRVEIITESWLSFPARIGKLLEEAPISVWNSVPSALVQLANHGALETRKLDALRLIMFAGEPFPIKHLRTLHQKVPQAKLLNVYGQTEANSSTYFEVKRVPEDDAAPLPVGKTFPNYDVLLLDEAKRPITAPDVEGELYVVGGAVASGYFLDPERTAKAFVDHPLKSGVREIVYKTGDRFAYDQRGDLVFKGRMDSAVKVRGFRVELSEVESALASHPQVQEAAVLALPHEAMGHALIAFISPPGGAEPPADPVLIAHAAARIPRYMLPVSVITMKSLPRTPNGKIDRRSLEEPARAAVENAAIEGGT